MVVRTFTGGGFGENAYLVVCETSGAAIVVDPGEAASRIVEAVDAEGLDVQGIVLTHAHLDHVEGVHAIREAVPAAPIWIHPLARGMYDALPQQAAMFGLSVEPQPAPDRDLQHGGTFRFGDCELEVRHAPGHAPGHVILVAARDGFALVGDVVFQGSIGRTDLPGGDFQTLMSSIREQVMTLPDETALYSGHGPPTTVGHERVGNPFLIPHYGGGLA